ncbi:unnamed protein product [Ceutorhynchus assimilis]|uniref:V-SNARE coiled-coil homology domain-containing protein n=1 Tax=Ceutorhynchus assimilis TaxID=467358 RepID=A0A9N9MVV9_9CUCU|nr:unnamed protein product [Ceutorhynchus assimilis]
MIRIKENAPQTSSQWWQWLKSRSKLSTKLQQSQQQVDEETEMVKVNLQQMDAPTEHLEESEMFEKTDVMDHPTASEQQYLLEKNKREVEAVTQILKNNVDKMTKRGANISDLNSRMQNLQGNSTSFRTIAVTTRRKYWWKNVKTMIIIGVVLTILLIIIISVVATH